RRSGRAAPAPTAGAAAATALRARIQDADRCPLADVDACRAVVQRRDDGRGADVRHGQRGKRLDEVDERVPAEGEGRQELELRLRDTRLGVRERGEGRAAET